MLKNMEEKSDESSEYVPTHEVECWYFGRLVNRTLEETIIEGGK
jgi:hypothetical protein